MFEAMKIIEPLNSMLCKFSKKDLNDVEVMKAVWRNFERHDVEKLPLLKQSNVALLCVKSCTFFGDKFTEFDFVSFLKFLWNKFPGKGLNIYMENRPQTHQVTAQQYNEISDQKTT